MKIDLRTNLAYGIGQAGDTIPYCMFYTFFLYFLTDNVGLSPMLAGTISLLAVCWDGITDPIVGYLSDHTKCRYGRRRPWLIASIFPLGIVVFLIFAPFGNSPVYFLLMAMLFWTLYTSYVIPYMSLGSELTTDYNGRNYVRMFNMIVGGLFMLLCTSGPSAVQAWGIEHGFSDRDAWGISGGIFGVLTIICGLICWIATRGKEHTDIGAETKKTKESLFTVIKETFAIKPYRQLCVATFGFFIGVTIGSSALIYLLIYNCGMTDMQQALYWMIYAVVYVVMVPIGSALANKMGKKSAFLIGMIITSVALVITFIVGVTTFTAAVIMTVFYQFGSTVFWTNYLAFAYDVAEIDDYKNGKRREGSLCAIVSFAQKFGAAIGTYVTGSLLTVFGYNAMAVEQTGEALMGILGLSTIAPAIGGIFAIIIMARYPVTRELYDKIVKATIDKKAGKEVDETPFKHCL